MKKKTFINPHTRKIRRGLKDFFLWKMGYFDEEEEKAKGDVSFSFPNLHPHHNPEFPSVVWINHSTFLITIAGVNILTDPIWSRRCSPVSFVGPKRRHPPGIPFSELPKIDIVLLSHDHYDHLDKQTVLALSQTHPHISWFVPRGVKRWFDRRQIAPVYELGWGEEREVTLSSHKGKITAVPAQHYSGRKGYDLNATLWVGWVFDCGHLNKRFYFVGDTGYNPFDFKKIGEQFSPIDLCLIPIGCYQPKRFMEAVHINPDEAVRIHREVGSQLSIGMHWKTFHLADEPPEQPPYDLYQSLLKAKIDPREFLAVEPGHALNW